MNLEYKRVLLKLSGEMLGENGRLFDHGVIDHVAKVLCEIAGKGVQLGVELLGGPVGLDTLAATINEEAVTLEDVYEPYLLQCGFLTRTPRGRCVTQKAYQHLGLEYVGQQQFDL